MFVYSLKASTLKFMGVLLACAMIIGTVMLFLPSGSGHDSDTVSTFTAKSKTAYNGISSENDLAEFINSFGINTSGTPLEKVEIEIPRKFDAVLEEYEAIQKKQGLKLAKYKGKPATRYTYEILNYPKNSDGQPAGKVFLNLIIYKDKVIAGDICSAEMGGFIMPFTEFSPTMPEI